MLDEPPDHELARRDAPRPTLTRPTVTVCCLAGEPPSQVAAMLSLLRPVADEILVAVDSRIDPATLHPYRDVADRVVRYEFGFHPDRPRPWLHAQCRGEWILSIDADEVPSPALVAALPGLVEADDVVQYEFPRRWLSPASGTWLRELPWWPDFQVRLVRRGPWLRHSGHLHDSIERVMPSRHVDAPIYHLALVTTGEEERRRRSGAYEAFTPGLRAFGGGLLNATMYLPEDTALDPPSPVPAVDRPWIETVLAARDAALPTPDPAGPPLPAIAVAGRSEIDAFVQGPLADSDHRATITPFEDTGRMVPGETRPVYVRIRNDGSASWPFGLGRTGAIAVGHRWHDDDHDPTAAPPDDARRSPLTAAVEPGGEIIVPVFVEAPARAGSYRLEIDLVHEHVRWFGSPTVVDMTVEQAPARPEPPSTSTMLVTTIVARNYLPRAELLARSFRRHHPHGRVAVLVIDATEDDRRSWSDRPYEVLVLGDLGVDIVELHRMATIYDVTELATAVKPLLLQHLLSRHHEAAVTYLDPDIEVFAPLDDLDALARQHGIVLTPHRLDAVPDDGRQPDTRSLASSGVFNLGFIGVGPSSRPFLGAWAAHCRRSCIVAHDQGLFVDQRWVDAGVVGHPHHIVTDLGCNVAYWNVDTRPIGRGPSGYTAGGWPLRFFHYSGYDARAPHLLSTHQGDRPRTLLSEQPVLRELMHGYGRRLDEAAEATADPGRPYGWSHTRGGFPLDPVTRQIYRDELLRRERDETGSAAPVAALPDVFSEADDTRLLALLTSPLPGSEVPRVGRYLHLIYLQRPDVQAAYPNLRGDGLEHFHAWVRQSGRFEHDIPSPLVPPERPPTLGAIERRPPLRPGVNVVGYFAAELGIGEAGRAMLAALEHLGETCAVINETATSNRQQHLLGRGFDDVGDLDINLVVVNSDQTPLVMERLWGRTRPDQHTVGVWAWELEELPPTMLAGLPYVDEIWTYSRHGRDAIARAVATPVHVVPLPVVDYGVAPAGHHPLGIDADFTFLFCFDVHSTIARKNPFGVVEAFQRAFRPGEGPALIVKSINGRSALRSMEQLRAAAEGRPDIHIVDAYLDITSTRALIASCDCYVSLHRAEGFGYTMAEAMLAGRPVVATGYSGNLEFMDTDNSFLVGYSPGVVPAGCEPYPAGAVWAEPDIDDAARLMRIVWSDGTTRDRVASRGRRDILELHSPAARSSLIAARLAAIRARSRSGRDGSDASDRAARPHPVAQATWRAAQWAGRRVRA
ncbi:MAG: glycosyltransferase [Ilumatobacteraceae bacterium]